MIEGVVADRAIPTFDTTAEFQHGLYCGEIDGKKRGRNE